MTAYREYWQNQMTGEQYAVERDDATGNVLSAIGPLNHTEVTEDNLDALIGNAHDADLVDDLNTALTSDSINWGYLEFEDGRPIARFAS